MNSTLRSLILLIPVTFGSAQLLLGSEAAHAERWIFSKAEVVLTSQDALQWTSPARTGAGQTLRLSQNDASLFCAENHARLPSTQDLRRLYESPAQESLRYVKGLAHFETPIVWTDENRSYGDYWAVGFNLKLGQPELNLYWDDEFPAICVLF
jgi:hypothetical protein